VLIITKIAACGNIFAIAMTTSRPTANKVVEPVEVRQ
jgi:hypothetical protein